MERGGKLEDRVKHSTTVVSDLAKKCRAIPTCCAVENPTITFTFVMKYKRKVNVAFGSYILL